VLVSSCGAAAFCCAPALAVVPPFRYEATLSEGLSEELRSHTGASFEELWGVRFDSSGNLFVADALGRAGRSIIDKFNSAGAFQAQLGEGALKESESARGVAVSDETGHVYVGDLHHSEIFALSVTGEKLSQWTGVNTPAKTFGAGCCAINVAVDNSTGVSKGDVYAAIAGIGSQESEVDVFEVKNGDKEEGEFVRKLNLPGGTKLGPNSGGIAVNDANGEVYVVDEKEHGSVDRFSPTGEFEVSAQIKGPSAGHPFVTPIAVAVDGATGDVFVIDHQALGSATKTIIYEFTASGELLNTITETAPAEALEQTVALAVERAGPHAGDLYVSDQAKKRIDVFAPLPPEAPTIVGEPVTEVSAEGASLGAEINPRGAITQYRIEYGRCAAPNACGSSPYERRTPEPDATLAGAEDFDVHSVPAVRVLGLSPETTYHMRVIAHNANGQTSGEERIFTTQGPGGLLQLPDGREWELVSPPDKHAAVLSVPFEAGVIQAAANGDAITYLANAPTESASQGYAGEVQVLSTRTAGGWSSRDLATPHEAATGLVTGTAPEYRYFTEGLSAAIVQPFGLFDPALSGGASEQTPYLRTLGSCESNCYRPLVTGKAGFSNVPPGTRFGEEARCEENNAIGGAETVCGPRFLGASGDGSRFVLMSGTPLVAGAPAGGVGESGEPFGSLYEWSAGHLELVSILPPNGKGEELPAPTGPREPLLGSIEGNGAVRRAISTTGSRVFWEAGGALYVRDTTKQQTLQIDAAEAECLAKSKCESGAGRFQIASVDGSRVYFTDERRLTGNAGAVVKEPDLYECKIAEVAGRLACELKDLTPSAGKGANVQGEVLGASEDGSILYFVADGALVGSGASERGTCVNVGENAQPVGSRCNLYELQNGQARFVTVLSGMDAKVWTQSTEDQPSRVSPSGQWLTFMSARSLTGYDNRDAISGKPDAEVFLYDNVGAGSLVCASCNPSGARPRGAEYRALQASKALPVTKKEWESTGWVSALLPHMWAIGGGEPVYQPRYLSDQGRLFFDSLDALVPQDVNGTGDVYEYEPAEVGSCIAAAGCVGLISSGTSPESSVFLDASSSGDDVFFLTSSQLSSQDKDSRMDVYDAHVCTGAVPCLARAAAEPPPCITEASCKPAPSVQPSIFGAPASATFSGPRNVISEPAARARKAKPPTRAQLLRRALAACHKHHPRSRQRRSACERQAHRRYAPARSAHTAPRRSR
jgi:DNA-binding beta-propeller fold protein YncE